MEPAPFFNRGPGALARLVVLSTLAIVFMVVDARQHYLDTFRQSLAVIIYPLQQTAVSPRAALNRMRGFFIVQTRLYDANQILAEKNRIQGAQLQRLAAMDAENKYLRRLVNAKQRISGPSVLGEILYNRPDPFSRKILLNKGTRDSVAAGQPVINDLGVVGQVIRAYPFTSEVALITDKLHATPVQIVRNGLRAVAFGNGQEGTMDLPFMPTNADIVTGDELVTSGIDGIYPAGIPVGIVTKIERNSADAFSRIACKPHGGVESYAQVLILQPAQAKP